MKGKKKRTKRGKEREKRKERGKKSENKGGKGYHSKQCYKEVGMSSYDVIRSAAERDKSFEYGRISSAHYIGHLGSQHEGRFIPHDRTELEHVAFKENKVSKKRKQDLARFSIPRKCAKSISEIVFKKLATFSISKGKCIRNIWPVLASMMLSLCLSPMPRI